MIIICECCELEVQLMYVHVIIIISSLFTNCSTESYGVLFEEMYIHIKAYFKYYLKCNKPFQSPSEPILHCNVTFGLMKNII